MSGTHEGALKGAAAKAGCSLEDYQARLAAGERWCWSCGWCKDEEFGLDLSRVDGRSRVCRDCKNMRARKNYTGRRAR